LFANVNPLRPDGFVVRADGRRDKKPSTNTPGRIDFAKENHHPIINQYAQAYCFLQKNDSSTNTSGRIDFCTKYSSTMRPGRLPTPIESDSYHAILPQ